MTETDYEWAETHGDGAENRPPPGEGWEYVGPPLRVGGKGRVSRWRRARVDALRAGAEAMVEEWVAELRDYPPSTEGRYAAAAVASCIKELRALLRRTA